MSSHDDEIVEVGEYCTVEDLQGDETLCILQDGVHIEEVSQMHNLQLDEYGCLLVRPGHGEFEVIYGCFDAVPRLTSRVERVR